MVFDVIFVLVQATTVALCAAFATAIVLDAWPTPAGILGVFLLYVVLEHFPAELNRRIHKARIRSESTQVILSWEGERCRHRILTIFANA